VVVLVVLVVVLVVVVLVVVVGGADVVVVVVLVVDVVDVVVEVVDVVLVVVGKEHATEKNAGAAQSPVGTILTVVVESGTFVYRPGANKEPKGTFVRKGTK
jgi:hypothetical protein